MQIIDYFIKHLLKYGKNRKAKTTDSGLRQIENIEDTAELTHLQGEIDGYVVKITLVKSKREDSCE